MSLSTGIILVKVTMCQMVKCESMRIQSEDHYMLHLESSIVEPHLEAIGVQVVDGANITIN